MYSLSPPQFEQAGIKDDDLLVIVRNPSATATTTPAASSSPSSFTARSGMRLHEIPVSVMQCGLAVEYEAL